MVEDNKINITDLFPVPLITIDLKEVIPGITELNKNLIKNLIENMTEYGFCNATGKMNIFQSYRNLEYKCDTVRLFLDKIKPIFDRALSKINYDKNFIEKYCLNDVWGNLTSGLGYHNIHVHGSGKYQPFSAVYFPCEFVDPEDIDNIILKKNYGDKEDLGNLVFYAPNWEIKQISYKTENLNTIYSQTAYPIPPKESTLIIFPSFLAHTVTPSLRATKNNARISFSFFASML